MIYILYLQETGEIRALFYFRRWIENDRTKGGKEWEFKFFWRNIMLYCLDVKLFSLHWVQEDSVVGMTLEHTMYARSARANDE